MAHSYIPSLLFLLSSFVIYIPHLTNASPPAIFIFGDSTSDVGTNNEVSYCTMRADFPPYGIDYPNSTPTGRFSNGYNTADFISKLLGFSKSPEPYMISSSRNSAFRRGVNFASAGSGLLERTGQGAHVVSVFDQIEQFNIVYTNLKATMGDQSSFQYFILKSIYIFSLGSNDILANFVNYKTVLSKEPFIRAIMTGYERIIKEVYNLGARRFGFICPLAIGCAPAQRIYNATGGCLEVQNDISLAFYFELDLLLYRISSELPGFKYSIGNTYEMMMGVIDNHASLNFKVVDTACCGGGRLNGVTGCKIDANLCKNRNEYAFWDGYHPTQEASYLVAKALYDGEQRYVSPINFYQLQEDT